MSLARPDGFGSLLQELCRIQKVSVTAITSALLCDRSTVYRWKRGERLPDSIETVTAIASILRLDREQTMHLVKTWDDSRSKSIHPSKTNLPPRTSSSLLEAIKSGSRPFTLLPAEPALDDPNVTAVMGRDLFVQTAIDYLSELSGKGDWSELVIHYQGRSPFSAHPRERDWLAGLSRLLQSRPIVVKHVVKNEHDPDQPVRLAVTILSLLGLTGTYSPRFVTRSSHVIPVDVIAVPEGKALVLLRSSDDPVHDIGLILRDPDQVYHLVSEVRALWDASRPLVVGYQDKDQLAFEEEMRKAAETGAIGLAKSGFTTLTQPPVWWEEQPDASKRNWAYYIEQSGLSLVQMRQLRRYRLTQLQLHQHSVRFITSRSSVDSLLREGLYSLDDPAQKAGYILNEERSIEYLEHVISFLLDPKNEQFEMAMIDDLKDRQSLPFFHGYSWMVSRHCVSLEIKRTLSDNQEHDFSLAIWEPGTVAAFNGAFEDAWDTISPRERSRGEIIHWLRRRLEKFRENDHLPRMER